MADRLEIGRRLYAALQAREAAVLEELLAEEFVGRLTAGLPEGFGRTYAGRASMLRAWGAMSKRFGTVPEVEFLVENRNYLVGRGWYVGQVPATNQPFRAAFAHFWEFHGETIVALDQVTDSAAWHGLG